MATLGELMLPTTTLGQLIGASAPGTTNVPQVTPATPPPAAPTLASYMKQPKDWQKILGIIGDALQTAGGGRGSFVPMLQAQREKAAEQQQAYDLAERKFNNERHLAQMKAAEPPALAQNYNWWNALDPQSKAAFAQYQDVVQPKFVTGPDGQIYHAPSAASPAAPSTYTDPETNVSYRLKPGATNPNDPASWEEIGGPTQPASAAFP